MKSKNKLLNEITKRVKIKLLQEANTPPEIDDILDRLHSVRNDRSKLSDRDREMLDYYAEHGELPEETSIPGKDTSYSDRFHREERKDVLRDLVLITLSQFDDNRGEVDFALLTIIQPILGSGIKLSDMETGFIMDVINEWADDSITTEECAEHIVEFVFGLLEGDEEGAY